MNWLVESRVHVGLAIVLAVSAVAASYGDPYFARIIYLAALWSVLAVALNLIYGYAGQLHLAHGSLFGVGAYATAIATTRWGWAWFPAVIAGVLVPTVVAVIFGWIALRSRGLYFALMTICFGVLFVDFLSGAEEWTGGTVGMPVVAESPFSDARYCVTVLIVALLLLLLTSRWALRRPLGRSWLAIREDEILAASLGARTHRAKMVAFVWSAAVAGGVGAIFALNLRYLTPEMFDFATVSFQPVLMVIVGGAGTLWGPIIGAALITTLPEFLHRSGGYAVVLYAVLLLVVIKVAPRGLVGMMTAAASRLSARSVRSPTTAPPPSQPSKPIRLKAALRPAAAHPAGPLLDARQIEVRFSGLRALAGVDVSLAPGETLGIIGPNGAGKSTLLDVISGHRRPTSGSMLWSESPTRNWHRWTPTTAARSGMSRTFQTNRVFKGLTVRANLLTALDFGSGRYSASELEDLARLSDRAGDLAGSLSHGEGRRLTISMALATEPLAVLMDEPAAGLTMHEVELLTTTIRELRSSGVAVVVVEHNMEFLFGVADRVVVLDAGSVIAAGHPDEIRGSEAVRAAYLGGGNAPGT